jgi:hypothetical protein
MNKEPKCTHEDGHSWSLRSCKTFRAATFLWLFGETNYQSEVEKCRYCGKQKITITNLDDRAASPVISYKS